MEPGHGLHEDHAWLRQLLRRALRRAMARRIEGHPYEQGFDLRLWPSRLDQPERWRKKRMIFVNSMSDLFHKGVPREFIDQVFDRMETTDRHIYQVLTKRSSRMRDYLRRRYPDSAAPRHIWCGVSVEDQSGTVQNPPSPGRSGRRFAFSPSSHSSDPSPTSTSTAYAWVIAGGESGPNARPSCELEWVRHIRDRCASEDVPFFFKQWGGATPKAGGRELDKRGA